MEEEILPKLNYLFEASWEVCNKIGGIYTVIKEKAPSMMKYYKNYYTLGPYLENISINEFLEEKPSKEWLNIFDELNKKGIRCFYGKWEIPGKPNCILVDFKSLIPNKNMIKYELWERYKIDSLRSGWDFEEPILWAYATSLLLQEIEKFFQEKIVVHCHEWLSGPIILNLKWNRSKIKTVFTTHATMLGRALASTKEDFYEVLPYITPEAEAYKFYVEAKFLTERETAKACDVFTTVSQITLIEAEKLLGRKPDLLLINGMNTQYFPTIEETSIKHITSRQIIREFLKYYFLPYYTKFDVEKTLLFYISCRYEFRNKGIDVFIEALGKLNKKLIEEDSEITVVVFFWIPMPVKGIISTLLENKEYYYHIKRQIRKNLENIATKMIDEFMSMREPHEVCLSWETIREIFKETLHFKRSGNPPILTHRIENEKNDPIIKALLAQELDNREKNKVKVIVYPIYLTGDDNLLDLTYYDAIAGCHLGIFPSYYEPWGYTPLESSALGVPSVTSDLSGFGKFIETNFPQKEEPFGIYVLKRLGVKREEFINSLYETLYKFVHLSHSERVANKVRAKELSSLMEWSHLIKNYIKAHNLAVEPISSNK